MKTHFILLKITTDGDVPDLADKAAGRIYTASGVRDCVVITPMLELPTRAVDVSGEELWSRDQVLQVQIDAYAEGRRDEAVALQPDASIAKMDVSEGGFQDGKEKFWNWLWRT